MESKDAQKSLDLMQAVIMYRHDRPTRSQITKIGKHSMLHHDVLVLAHHLAKISTGHVLEIGSFVGGSTIAAALGIRASGQAKHLFSIEPGGRLKGHKLATRDIFKRLKKNLARFGVSDSVQLIHGTAEDPATVATVQAAFAPGSVGFFIFDAHSNVGYDLDLYADRFQDECWIMIDDYFGPSDKTGPTREQVDAFVAAGRLVPLGFYGWGSWFGRWRVLPAPVEG